MEYEAELITHIIHQLNFEFIIYSMKQFNISMLVSSLLNSLRSKYCQDDIYILAFSHSNPLVHPFECVLLLSETVDCVAPGLPMVLGQDVGSGTLLAGEVVLHPDLVNEDPSKPDLPAWHLSSP